MANDRINFTATGRYYKVYRNGEFVSQHTTEREASQKAANELLQDNAAAVHYTHDYVVEAEFVAGDEPEPPDSSLVIPVPTRVRNTAVTPGAAALTITNHIIVPRMTPLATAASTIVLDAASYEGTENTVTQFSATRTDGYSDRVSVDWTLTGAAATPAAGTITFPVGEGQQIVVVELGEVAVDKGGFLALTNPQNLDGGPTPVFGDPYYTDFTVYNEPEVTDIYLNLGSSGYSGNEDTLISFAVNRTGALGTTAVSVDWAITGVAATPASGTATFAADDAQVSIEVAAGLVTGTTVGTLTLSNPQNLSGDANTVSTSAPATASFTVVDVGITISTISDITLSVGGTHDMSQYINNPQSETITTSMTGLNAAFATYSDTTKLLTGVAEGTLTGVTLKVETAGWQLPASNYVSTSVTGMLPEIIHPRPTSEAGAYARHKWAYPGVRYEIPIAVQGGSYPFKFTITGTSGAATNLGTATIGETLTISGDVQIRGDDYGVLEWTPLLADDGLDFGFTVRVEDQDGNIDDVEILGTIQASQFIFYDSTHGGTNAGTEANPYNDWPTAFGTDSAVANNAGKVCYFRTGDHVLTGYAGNTGNLQITASNKPLAWINYPDESPRIDLGSGHITLSNQDDTFFAGIDFHDNDQSGDTALGRMFTAANGNDRCMWWRNTFTNYYSGSNSSSNNPAVVFFFAAGGNYVGFISNVLSGTQGAAFHSYGITYGVIEDNSYDGTVVQSQGDGSNTATLYLKDSPENVSIRANDMTNYLSWPNTIIKYPIAQSSQNGAVNVELCWNKTKHPVNGISIMGKYTSNPKTNLHCFRNSVPGISAGNAHWTDGAINYNISETTVEAGLLGDARDSGNVISATSTTVVVDGVDNIAGDDYLINCRVSITSGTGAGQIKTIIDHEGAFGGVNSHEGLTVDSAWSTQPDATSTHEILRPSGLTSEGNVVGGLLDSDMNLVDRVTYLGTHGAEVA